MKSVTLPINYATLGYGPEGAIPSRGLVDYTLGPSTVNVGWALRQQYTKRWVFWQPTGGGLRGSVWVPGFDTSDASGQLFPEFFVGETVGPFSACFDATGYPMAVTDGGVGNIRIQTINNGSLVEYVFPGSSPRAFSMAGLVWQDADLLVVVYYIGSDGSIKARYQLDEYDTEVTVCVPATPVKKLTKVDFIDRRICLWAVGDQPYRHLTRQLCYRTAAYDNLPPILKDSGALSFLPQGTVFLGNIQYAGLFAEGVTAVFDPQGAVIDTIALVTIPTEATTLDLEPQGDVSSVVIDSGSFAESATVDMEPQAGVLDLIEAVPPIAESVTAEFAPQGAVFV